MIIGKPCYYKSSGKGHIPGSIVILPDYADLPIIQVQQKVFFQNHFLFLEFFFLELFLKF